MGTAGMSNTMNQQSPKQPQPEKIGEKLLCLFGLNALCLFVCWCASGAKDPLLFPLLCLQVWGIWYLIKAIGEAFSTNKKP